MLLNEGIQAGLRGRLEKFGCAVPHTAYPAESTP
jgi:hypothetical protein